MPFRERRRVDAALAAERATPGANTKYRARPAPRRLPGGRFRVSKSGTSADGSLSVSPPSRSRREISESAEARRGARGEGRGRSIPRSNRIRADRGRTIRGGARPRWREELAARGEGRRREAEGPRGRVPIADRGPPTGGARRLGRRRDKSIPRLGLTGANDSSDVAPRSPSFPLPRRRFARPSPPLAAPPQPPRASPSALLQRRSAGPKLERADSSEELRVKVAVRIEIDGRERRRKDAGPRGAWGAQGPPRRKSQNPARAKMPRSERSFDARR
ncbi:hypothetical protein KM043_001810 [Ampulex compressa]|nr:hypothetical protein KM043_001810 [Ampulex compressa]